MYHLDWENDCEEEVKGVIFVLLAVLFQPFFKIALGRTDIIVAIGLFYLIVTSSQKKNQ